MTRIDWKARVSPEQVYARAAGRRRINKERQVMVAGRRLRLLEELKLGGQNYYQLAGLFNVSTRTVQRDVRALLGMNWEKCSRCGGLRRTRP